MDIVDEFLSRKERLFGEVVSGPGRLGEFSKLASYYCTYNNMYCVNMHVLIKEQNYFPYGERYPADFFILM